mgnify:CR=1 FL=1
MVEKFYDNRNFKILAQFKKIVATRSLNLV